MTKDRDLPPAAVPDAGAPQEHEPTDMTEQAWLERYREQFIRRGLDARLADDCAKAEPFAVLSEMFEDDPEGAADEELSYWEADDDV